MATKLARPGLCPELGVRDPADATCDASLGKDDGLATGDCVLELGWLLLWFFGLFCVPVSEREMLSTHSIKIAL